MIFFFVTEKNWQKYKGQKAFPDGSKPPPAWKCRNCFQNHWVNDCPYADSALKRTTGMIAFISFSLPKNCHNIKCQITKEIL